MKKIKYITLLGLSSLLLVACGESSDVTVESSNSDSTTAEVSSEAKSSEETSVPGKRSNPVSIGESASWDVLYSDADYVQLEGTVTTTISNLVRGEEAFNYLMEANEFNEAAPEGYEWIIFDMSLVLDEGSEDDPFNTSTILITPISSDGSEVAQSAYATFEDGTDFGWKDLYKGGKDSGKVGLIIPQGDETLIEISDMNTSVFYKLN
ncbi:hypothetical protein [Carnobacterium sp. ISL-102]|uniref:hypothetical protein n=1 Tax=Carnobacterium sp. ISL-102 TaxID=2819142 RepID=UPI001BEAD323|nr:hypothetical protein [Carnobacterium sp. ISL-102]MBT2732043.1 hypothetical protein [Carnobacterium sp. ISL-102]